MLKLRPPESKKAESGVADMLRILLLSSTLLNLPTFDFSRLKNTQTTTVPMFGFNSLCPHCHALPKEARKTWQFLTAWISIPRQQSLQSRDIGTTYSIPAESKHYFSRSDVD